MLTSKLKYPVLLLTSKINNLSTELQKKVKTVYTKPCENKAKGFMPFHQQAHTRPHKHPLHKVHMGQGDPEKVFTVIPVRPGCFLKLHFPPLA